MTNKPLITAIVINWNGSLDLKNELPSLTSQTYKPLEILVVDNGSTDDSFEVVKSFPNVTWIPLGKNFGFAGALNLGANIAKGEIILLLNNDMRFAEDFIEKLANPILTDETVFATDGLQYDWEGKTLVHAATFLGVKKEKNVISNDQIIPGLVIRQETRENLTNVLMASGANLMARRNMFLELGGLDGGYPIGFEDTDICWRAWMNNWKTIFVPDAVCWHDVGRSAKISKKGASNRFKGNLKGGLLFSMKLLPNKFIIAMVIRVLLGFLKDLIKLNFSRFKDRSSVLFEFFTNFPKLVKERHRFFQKIKKTPKEVLVTLKKLN